MDFNDILSAKERIKDLVKHTPCSHSDTFSKMIGANVYLKLENQQKTGSFKIRGAGNKISKMMENGDYSPVITSSAGNHAQGVACAATKFGIQSTVVMPAAAPIAKVQATKGYGAEVVLHGSVYDESYDKACEICKETGAKFIHPYDDPDVIAGQGTIGLEIMEDLPDADIVLVPAGGGGILSGISYAVKKINPNVKVYGVQAEGADAISRSFQQKERVCIENANTIADGIAVKNPGNQTVNLINQYVDDVFTVSDYTISEAILLLMERSKQVVEAAGAVPLAALLEKKVPDVEGKNVVCVISGGNIDVSLIGSLIDRGLLHRHRNAEFYVIIQNNKLREITNVINIISSLGGIVENVKSEREAHYIRPNETLYTIQLSTTGEEQENEIFNTLVEKKYNISRYEDIVSLYESQLHMKNYKK